MSQPESTVEICTFVASQNLLDDETLIHPVYDLVAAGDGLQHIYEGAGIEEPTKRWLFVAWKTYEDHEKLINGPTYGEVGQKLTICIGADFKMQHVLFESNSSPALTAPITRITTFTLKDASKRSQFEKTLDEIVHVTSTKSQYHPFTFGPSREDPNVYIYISGWESAEAGNVTSLALLESLAEFKIEHAKVREYGIRTHS